MKACIPYTGQVFKSKDEAKTEAYNILSENPEIGTLAIYKIKADHSRERWFNVWI